MKKLLLVEDDRWILAWLKLYMEGQDFIMETHTSWEWAIEKILSGDYDLVTLDLNLPVIDWTEICREVRKLSNIPIIMLTARDNESAKIAGLEIWADDYITKPFSPRELLARIKTILRRSEKTEELSLDLLSYEEFSIDLESHTISKNWEEIHLTKSEFDIFIFLVKNRWKLVSRDTLMKEIIGYDRYVFDRTVDTHIKNLRRKLWNKEIIETIRWEWYKIK